MSKNILLLFLLSFSIYLHGQIRKISEQGNGLINLERHQVKLNMFGPGVSYELGLFRNVSVSTSLGPAIATYSEGYTFGFAWHTRLRYYHNFKRRLDMRKNVTGNSGDYLSAARSVFWAPLQLSNNLDAPSDFALAFYGGVYGIQRTYPKGFNFTAELGLGYYRGDGVLDGYGPLFNFTFGWVATKRRNRKPVIKY
ncbi:hypothetical protein FGM00_12775 [Aggregatimonas sangjinii]|uniref:DUF3575 domain-containing protein n=1 Tax=Aggregatimonas sangjinii TaxID=2583587 RepID=A0A5B7SZ55_9FLAO|nr:hypothetical protein [Aggregatimonas sangjinii]QCX02368.1 hypothetical protein FGM00_12775 [Aggregatimonas sangjinii]